MVQKDASPKDTKDRAHEIAEARIELLRLAEEQGVSPVTNFDDLLGDASPEDAGDASVDEFLRALREWRSTPSHRSVE